MKKSLLATTALAALGAVAVAGPATAAEKIKVSVGGYMEQWFGYSDNKEAVNRTEDGFDQQSDGEIHFKGSTVLDNGIKIGINVQLESQTDGDQIDEQFAYAESETFGRINLGSENAASYLMHFGIPSHGVGTDSGDHVGWIAGYDFTGGRTNGRGPDNDSEKLTYFTPRVSGFQAGASYIPEIQQDRDASTTTTGVRTNGFSVAGNFKEAFGDVKVQASAGYTDFGNEERVANTTNLQSFQFGLRLGFGGFGVAGTYGEEDRTGAVQVDAGTQETMGLGVNYAAGPVGVSLAYVGSERDNSQQEQDAFELGAKYKLGPGVDLRGAILYAEGDNAAGTEVANGFAVVGGLKLGF